MSLELRNSKKNRIYRDCQEERNIQKQKIENTLCDFQPIPTECFVLAFLTRLISCIIVRTYFVPDEYWQSTEVAHRRVFKYGYVTWEWRERIRSYLYPSFFELYFRILDTLGMDSLSMIRYGPYFMQAFLTSFSDVAVYRISLKLSRNRQIANYSFYLNLFSWFLFYTGSRTLSNTAEMCFTSMGLSYFPLNQYRQQKNSLSIALLFGGIACIIRPTCALIWVPLVLVHLLQRKISISNFVLSSLKILPLLLLLSFGVDYYYYGTFTFAHWNFVVFNVFKNIGEFYGTHPAHWYLTQGMPVVLSIHLVFIIPGMTMVRKSNNPFVWIIILFLLVLSLIPHKEFRFLLPVFPMFMCYAGQGMKSLVTYVQEKKLYAVVLILNIAPAVYFSTIHQRGAVHVMEYLASMVNKNDSILFLMPCHSTPYYSYMHQNVTMRFLTCEPDRSVGYLCESDRFYADPVAWLEKNVRTREWSHFVLYDRLAEIIGEYLQLKNYHKATSLFHTHFPEGRIGTYVNIYTYT